MNRFRSLTITGALITLLVGWVAAAQGPSFAGRRGPEGLGGPGGYGLRGGRGGPGGGLPIRELNLSDTQQQQIRDLTQQYREQNRTATEQLRVALQAQRQAMETVPVNEGLIRSTTQALVEAQTELAIQHARMQSEIFTLLTPAQQEQAKKLQAEREARMQLQRQRLERRQQPRQ